MSQNQSVNGIKEEEQSNSASEETGNVTAPRVQKQAINISEKGGANLSNLFLILGALFLALGFVGKKLFD